MRISSRLAIGRLKDRHVVMRRKQTRRNLGVERLEQRVVFNTYWVSNLADAGPGSIRSAIEAANSNPGEDTVRFRQALKGTIALKSELVIADDLRVRDEFNDRRTVRISGENQTRVFRIGNGVNPQSDSQIDVRFENVTVVNGLTSDAAGGGGILNYGNLELKKSVISGNRSLGSTTVPPEPAPIVNNLGQGGGIRNFGKLTVTDSEISKNSAGASGGGLSNEGIATIDDSRVTGNRSGGQSTQRRIGTEVITSTIRGEAGGISNWTSPFTAPSKTISLTIIDSEISNNVTGGDGAGVYSGQGTKLQLLRSSVTGNEATSFGTGGIAVAGDLNLIDSKVNRNLGFIGGVYNFADFGSTPESIHIVGSEISGNKGSPNERDSTGNFRPNSVGGLALRSRASVSIESSNINENVGSTSVGGISFAFNKLAIVNSTVSGNRGNSAGGVGGFLTGSGIPDAGLTVESSTISHNHAAPTRTFAAGGILGPAKLVNSTISGNTVNAEQMVNTNYPSEGPAVAGGWLAGGGAINSITSSTAAQNRVTNVPSFVPSAGGILGFSYSYETEPGVIFESDANIQTRNTVIAKNEISGVQNDVRGSFMSGGHNFVGVLADNATGFVDSDLRGTTAEPKDPRLGPLAWNGGRTMTHRPLLFSPLINAGDNADAPSTDQRGFYRISLGRIVIGAVEWLSLPAPSYFESLSGLAISQNGVDESLVDLIANERPLVSKLYERSDDLTAESAEIQHVPTDNDSSLQRSTPLKHDLDKIESAAWNQQLASPLGAVLT